MLCLARKGYKTPTICNLLKAENLSCTRENVLKRYVETHSIARKPGSGRLSKVTAETKALFEQQMHIDDETTAHQLHRLLQSRGYKISLRTVLRCRGDLTFRGSAYCQLVHNVNKQKQREWAKANLMDAILKTLCGLMSVVSKWRATGNFAAGKSETLQSLSQGTCTGPTFS